MVQSRSVALIALLAAACDGPEPDTYSSPAIESGAPLVGAAEATLDLPVGTPLGGYSSRCGYLGGDSKVDNRNSAYTHAFQETAGVQTRPWVKAFWLEAGDEHLVIIKSDTIYSYDGLVVEVTAQLEEATGLDLDGKVVMTASHTHHAPGNFSDQLHFYLGGDRYNEEIFQRFALTATQVATEAWETREPAAVGTRWVKDWDPDDRVYRDRRGDNDELAVWDDVPPGYGKDPWLHVLRADTLDGAPIAMLLTFGMHGTILGGENPMVSTDSSGGFETAVSEAFDEQVVVMHLQGSGGDASPAGEDRAYARNESIGDRAVDYIVDAWEGTPTSADPLRVETASRHIPQHISEIEVTRDGEVDWTYRETEEGYRADDVLYNDDGSIKSPLDEFNAPFGAAFCGSDAPLIPVGNIGSDIFPYSACMDVELMGGVLAGIFGLDVETFPLPLPESLKAGTTASRIGPLTTLTEDGEELQQDLLVGFFPAETTGMFSEQWRRRAQAELGVERPLTVGYAQDHEGYFLIPEDWLMGGYEPNINIWGPLQAEHVMEGVLRMSEDVLSTTDVREDPDPLGWWSPTTYEDKPLAEHPIDSTPLAGQRIDTPPEYFWVPQDMTVDLTVPEQCPRVSCIIQMAWQGGDPAVDLPQVTLEREIDGQWQPVTTRSGRPVNDAWADIILSHTPDPLYPHDVEQSHAWWAAWQAVGHVQDRVGLPLGTYRLQVSGHKALGSGLTWPFDAEPYELASEPFELVAGALNLSVDEAGVSAWLQAPADGFRLVALGGDSQGRNPINGAVDLVWTLADGGFVDAQLQARTEGGVARLDSLMPADAVQLSVTDRFGNTGTLDL